MIKLMRKRTFSLVLALLFASIGFSKAYALSKILEVKKKPNILFIAIDDLNDMIKILDEQAITITPNLDRLAKQSTVFKRAYASSTLCNPSRFSLLTGLRPSRTGVYLNTTNSLLVEKKYRNIMTYFRDNGYKTIGVGKIFHGTQNQESAWDEYYSYKKNALAKKNTITKWPVIWGEVDEKFIDKRDKNITIKSTEILARDFSKPTFMAVGFHNPHLPWYYSEEEFKLYPLDKIKKPRFPEYDLDDVPKPAKKLAIQFNPLSPGNYHEQVIREGEWKHAIQSYLTGITRVDKELGNILDALEKNPENKNTIIVLWSDHGYHLGEKKHWNKHALWEKTTHVPLLVSMPEDRLNEKFSGKVCNQVVSLLDIFPTLIDLAKLPKLNYLQGRSFAELLEDPNTKWSHQAITTMGYKNHSIRTDRWRYIRYKNGSEELYDFKFDPNEFYNIAKLKSLRKLKRSFAKALPKKNVREVRE